MWAELSFISHLKSTINPEWEGFHVFCRENTTKPIINISLVSAQQKNIKDRAKQITTATLFSNSVSWRAPGDFTSMVKNIPFSINMRYSVSDVFWFLNVLPSRANFLHTEVPFLREA